jgi:hypothetical protein
VRVGSLLVPYPQYGTITQTGTDLRKARYQSLQLRVQRTFDSGFSFLATYAYVASKAQWFFDEQDEYDGNLSWMNFTVTQSGGSGAPSVTSDPNHRFVSAGNWELPIGKGRRIGNGMSPALNAIVGGWQLSAIYTYTSGPPLIFTRNAVAPASVKKIGETGTTRYWFDTAGFARVASFTRRTNPWYYDGLVGPGFQNMDVSLAKRVALTERFRVQVRLEAFNALNGMNWALPQLNETASDFGKTNAQAAGYYGRQLQYSVRLEF